MRRTLLVYGSWVALLAALIAWWGVVVLAGSISDEETARSMSQSSTGETAAQQEAALHLHTLALDTASERSQLNALVPTDIVGIVNSINAVGPAANVKTQIGSASAQPLPTGAPQGLSAIEFTVQSDGTFAATMRAAQMFETLPLPSSVDELDFEHIPSSDPKSPSSPWQLTVRILILTTAQISS